MALVYKRGKGKIPTAIGVGKCYEYYVAHSKNPVSNKVYRAILKEYYEGVINLIIFEGLSFYLPLGYGNIEIRKKKTKVVITKEGNIDSTRLPIDWKKSKALWEKLYPEKTAEEIKNIPNKPRVRHLNEHTDRYRFKIFWDNVICKFPRYRVYAFVPTRTFKNKVTEALKTYKNLQAIYPERRA